jgi:hypothetical protein
MANAIKTSPQGATANPDDGALPRGLKIALIASSSTILLVITLFSLLMFIAGDMQNSKKIETIASSFMKISRPLPEGFAYVSGVDFLGTKMVVISQAETGSVWNIVHLSACEGSLPPNMVISQIESAASTARKLAHTPGIFTVRQKGLQTVGGRTLTYETGEMIDGKAVSGSLIGCFMPNKEGTTCIFGSTPLGKFDSFANDELMAKIDSI